MADIEAAAPTFTHLLRTEAVPADNRIDVYFGAEDRSGYKLGIAAGIVPALMVELRGRMEQLSPGKADELFSTPLIPKAIQVAFRDGGVPALIVVMNGYELALELGPGTAKLLHEGLGQLLTPN